MSEKIETEEDVLGFDGVSKAGLLEFIDRAYGLTSRLEPLRGQFPIVTLKRKIMPQLDHCKDVLDAATGEKADKSSFDEFLTALTYVHDEIYLTFVVHCSEQVNIEADVHAATAIVRELQSRIEQQKPTIDELAQFLSTLEERSTRSEEILEEQEQRLVEARAKSEEIEDAKTSAMASAEVIRKFESSAKDQEETVVSLAQKATRTEKQIKTVIAEVNEKSKEIDAVLDKANVAAGENAKQQKEIAKTLQAASKYGMAVSFKERKDELKIPMWAWSGVFVIAMVALFTTGVNYIVPDIAAGKALEWTDISAKVALVSPLIWMGWMAAKQYGYIARIREDYSFKYASALAFEGYKKEAHAVDPQLLRDLLQVATSNLSLNPLRIYSQDDNDASPFHEVVSRVFGGEKRNGTTRAVTPSRKAAAESNPDAEDETQ